MLKITKHSEKKNDKLMQMTALFFHFDFWLVLMKKNHWSKYFCINPLRRLDEMLFASSQVKQQQRITHG